MSLDFYIMDKGIATGTEIHLFEANITHNVTPMWHRAGIFDDLYESEGKHPKDIIESLKAGLEDMINNPLTYKRMNPKNGWGSYDSAIKWLSDVINACAEYPEDTIDISR